jgi:hypothetical protein
MDSSILSNSAEIIDSVLVDDPKAIRSRKSGVIQVYLSRQCESSPKKEDIPKEISLGDLEPTVHEYVGRIEDNFLQNPDSCKSAAPRDDFQSWNYILNGLNARCVNWCFKVINATALELLIKLMHVFKCSRDSLFRG